ncbi:hypothetical protein JTE90_027981 [Oedothorax gibbosus]|uniref:Uncharacterized protein n=1 Tax=Oedothorax gibbosus TaxID=931172 RepID=A0AAV6VEL1_9ARAC|nr:hypothetical protein JTE90_027981 [Oedothorax gibbosus]
MSKQSGGGGEGTIGGVSSSPAEEDKNNRRGKATHSKVDIHQHKTAQEATIHHSFLFPLSFPRDARHRGVLFEDKRAQLLSIPIQGCHLLHLADRSVVAWRKVYPPFDGPASSKVSREWFMVACLPLLISNESLSPLQKTGMFEARMNVTQLVYVYPKQPGEEESRKKMHHPVPDEEVPLRLT